ncbi:MAG: TonB-dependent receptor [Pedobacter sp.]|nr:MAG: TonB-dependent receptor [Pedobacter sp.]
MSVNLNATYQDIRNAEKYLETGATNIVYKDRLRNKPFLMANAEVVINKKDLFAKASNASFYISTSYIHKYFLGWPSMAAKDGKENIPTQFVQDAGITYALKDNRYSISLGMRNVLNQQVYDDFLLQKPGRFSSVKLKYFLK